MADGGLLGRYGNIKAAPSLRHEGDTARQVTGFYARVTSNKEVTVGVGRDPLDPQKVPSQSATYAQSMKGSEFNAE